MNEWLRADGWRSTAGCQTRSHAKGAEHGGVAETSDH